MRRENKTQKGTQAKQQRKGFSLVELVVVIIIIAILAVAIFAGGSVAIKKAQISRAKSDLHNFDVAIQSYMFSDRKPVGLNSSSTDAEYLTVVNGLNKNLAKDYALKATGLTADGKISTSLDHKYVYDSDKKDPWGNPYYFLVDPKERNSGETEYFFTVLSAGPNAKATVGGAVDKDDIFLLCQYSNSAVVSQTYSMSSDKKDATGTPLTVGTTILLSTDGTNAPRNIGAARPGSGVSGGGTGESVGTGGSGTGTGQDTPVGPTSPAYLTFSSPSSFTLKTNNGAKNWNGTLEYSTDTSTWTTWYGTNELSSGVSGSENVLYLRGTGNTRITRNSSSSVEWVLTGSNIACTGNIETLLDYATVESGEHPTMDNKCYMNMFYGCTALTQAPALPATTLSDQCYMNMFYGCTGLTQAPALPATTLSWYCYYKMFCGCTSLTTAPVLPATTLITCCYYGMFQGCSRLKLSNTQTGEYTQAYRVPASGDGTTATGALNEMFTDTGGTFTGTPSINTTYYLHSSNTIVPAS